jgi:PKD repeat protein
VAPGTTTTIPAAPPATGFATSPPAPRLNQPIAFNAAGSPAAAGKTIVGYAWDFGDGGTGSGVTTSHTYTAEGIYNVTLTMTDSDNNRITVSQPVSVLALVQTTSSIGASTFRTVRYVNAQAPASVPSDVTLVFELLRSGARSPVAGLAPRAVDTYRVRGVYRTPNESTGEVEGEMVGTITPNVVGTFTGSLSTIVQGCPARRRFSGQIDQLLMWTAGETQDTCSPSPWTYPSLTLQASQAPPATTTSTTSSSTTTTPPVTPGILTGVVTDSLGPVAGATVTAFNGAGASQGALTGRGGDYSIGGLAPGLWSVQVTHPDHVPQQNSVTIVSGSTTTYSPLLTSVTGPPGSLTGTVETEADTSSGFGPVFGATVTAFNAAGASQGVLTADNGSYTITGLAPGVWSVLVNHPDYFPQQGIVSIVSGAPTNHRVVLIYRLFQGEKTTPARGLRP